MLTVLAVVLISVAAIATLTIVFTGRGVTDITGQGLSELASSTGNEAAALLVGRVESMQRLAQEEEFLDEVIEQNETYSGGADEILAELTALDEQWISAADDDPLIQAKLTTPFAYELEEVKILIPDFAEVFVTDRHGGLVGSSDRTSDYYQADEEWWQAAYNDGAGAVFIAAPEIDESTGVTGIDIAVPIFANNGQVIGIIRTTLNVTALVDRLGQIQVGETGRADLLIGDAIFETHHEEHTGEEEEEP